ncbi:hypothetical protein B0H17DRAFT_1136465 [Mycena rosella]|uniref:NB-ARC domain-containing protein n=1 Tax=Mycena rosella TaxID=1033263 RepID=A0AAD7DAR0_MYCRO|nr:hypothetical protein B0H17DRAFT_1136465 [Mycena rosella]
MPQYVALLRVSVPQRQLEPPRAQRGDLASCAERSRRSSGGLAKVQEARVSGGAMAERVGEVDRCDGRSADGRECPRRTLLTQVVLGTVRRYVQARESSVRAVVRRRWWARAGWWRTAGACAAYTGGGGWSAIENGRSAWVGDARVLSGEGGTLLKAVTQRGRDKGGVGDGERERYALPVRLAVRVGAGSRGISHAVWWCCGRSPPALVVAADGACHVPARRGLTRWKKDGGNFRTADVIRLRARFGGQWCRSKHVPTYDSVAVNATLPPALSTHVVRISLQQVDGIMSSRDDSRSLYIVGGQGGHGGQAHGTGGPGGAGLGPTVHMNVQQLIAPNLHATPTSEQALQLSNIRASQIANHCPLPSRIFQGRRDILDEMHHFFTSNMRIQHIYVLHGLGGAGKTQAALKFIDESSSHFSDIFFIDASTIVTIETGLKNIAVMKDFGDAPQDGLLWLTNRVEEWLLVFDNADDPDIALNRFLPQCHHGNIIITSRNPELCVYAGSHSRVSDMEEEDAVALLLSSAAQKTTIGTNKLQKKLYSEKPAQSHDRYAWTVYTTWQMSFDKLKAPAAMFLQYCAFLHYNGISEEIFSRASEYTFPSEGPSKEELQEPLEFLSHFLGPSGEWDSLEFSNMTNEVQAYSLISFDRRRNSFPSIHWIYTGHGSLERPEHDIQLGSLAICPHVELAVQMDAKVALLFREQYVFILWEGGKARQNEKLLEEMLEEQKQLQGDNHADTLRTMGNLASTYSHLGEHRKAEELDVTVLEKRKQVLGDNHPDTLLTMGNLASTYSHLGEHRKAEELDVTVLEKRKQVLGDNHPDTLLTMGNLANTYSDLGEHRKAEELNVTVLEKRKQVLGDHHPDTLLTMGNLASTYSHLGEHRKAEELKVTVLEKQKQDRVEETDCLSSCCIYTSLWNKGHKEVCIRQQLSPPWR